GVRPVGEERGACESVERVAVARHVRRVVGERGAEEDRDSGVARRPGAADRRAKRVGGEGPSRLGRRGGGPPPFDRRAKRVGGEGPAGSAGGEGVRPLSIDEQSESG